MTTAIEGLCESAEHIFSVLHKVISRKTERIDQLEAVHELKNRAIHELKKRIALLDKENAALRKVAELIEQIRIDPCEHSWPEMDELLIAAGYLQEQGE